MNEPHNLDDALLNQGAAQATRQASDETESHENGPSAEDEAVTQEDHYSPEDNGDQASDEETQESNDESESEEQLDDYGNERGQTQSKTYTEDEVKQRVNEAVRDRLARLERNQGQQQSGQPKNQQQQAEGQEDWRQQLTQIIEQTVSGMGERQAQQQRQVMEQQAQAEYESKFYSGAKRFSDFVEVVGNQPITDAMTYATRGLKDPAAFLYAAAKREAKELERISRIPDQYTQALEIGRLEARMRTQKPTTKSPKPVPQTRGDVTGKPKQKSPGKRGDDLLAQSNAQRMQNLRNRRGR